MTQNNGAALLDAAIARNQLKSDAALSRLLEVAPPVLSKVRHAKLPVGDALIVRVQEFAGMTLPESRQFVPRVAV